LIRPNKHLRIRQLKSINKGTIRERIFVDLHLMEFQTSLDNDRLYLPTH
jgi:hypothetical protein